MFSIIFDEFGRFNVLPTSYVTPTVFRQSVYVHQCAASELTEEAIIEILATDQAIPALSRTLADSARDQQRKNRLAYAKPTDEIASSVKHHLQQLGL